MGILEKEKLENELKIAYAVIELQSQKLKDVLEKLEHLESLLKYTATMLDTNKD